MKNKYLHLLVIFCFVSLLSGCAERPIVSGEVEELEIANHSWDATSKTWATQHRGQIDIYNEFAVWTDIDGFRTVIILNRLGKIRLKK